ncbi:hypothetical protein [Paenibacillus sp. 32O-W]|uniref:hypothetical protein n=1 Tax=Paenibacillus sp. 32O-W TaxID=1695218 RepID=UPI0011A7F26E|nr:hypothetical protein [Paenibacillus sp. 32O-W]
MVELFNGLRRGFQSDFDKAKDYHNKGVSASSYKLWLDQRVFDAQAFDPVAYPEPLEIQINIILAKLETYGDRINWFDKDWKQVFEGLREKDAEYYEPAFRDFATFLGYETERTLGQGTPDGIWPNTGL